MNEEKICFIICTNDAFLMRECRLYIENLELPEGFELEIQEIRNARSMAEGYNRGMHRRGRPQPRRRGRSRHWSRQASCWASG